MKIVRIPCLVLALISAFVDLNGNPPGIPADAFLIDTIKVVLYTEEGTDVIAQSEIRPSLEGTMRSLDDLVFERLMFQDAKKFRIIPDEDEIDKHLKAVQKENNITLDQLKQIFKAAGYTYEEGREQFAIMTTIKQILDFKIRSRMIVPEKEARAYYDENPVLEPAALFIERAFIPFDSVLSKGVIKSKLDRYLRMGPSEDFEIEWSAPFWVNLGDLAADRQFIGQLNPGQISEAEELEDGFELFRLMDVRPERLVPFEERYPEIANILVKPKYEQLMNEYKEQLFSTAGIVYY